MSKQQPQPIHPGEYIRDELEARGWTQLDLAEITERNQKNISQIISGKAGITARTAKELSKAFGTSPGVWLNLQSAYDLASDENRSDEIAERAKLYDLFPVREMKKRGWISDFSDPEDIRTELQSFLAVDDINEGMTFSFSAKKSKPDESFGFGHLAWIQAAINQSKSCTVAKFTPSKVAKHLPELLALSHHSKEVRNVPSVLAKMGIRFVSIKHLIGTKIDGAAIWIDKKTPLIALSLRYDRIDNFWHTLLHEVSHIKNGDESVVDIDVMNAHPDDEIEQRANRDACEWLINQSSLDSFFLRHKPRFSRTNIIQFANLHKVHPGIVVGQIHHRLNDYRILRKLLVPVRGIATEYSISDGWDESN